MSVGFECSGDADSAAVENAALENAGLEKCGNKNMAIVEWLN